jgi:hypothetical protein
MGKMLQFLPQWRALGRQYAPSAVDACGSRSNHVLFFRSANSSRRSAGGQHPRDAIPCRGPARHDRDEPVAGVRRGVAGLAGRRQCDRRRRHRGRGACRHRTQHERHRRRPAGDRLRRKNEEGLRSRFDRPLRIRRDAGRVCPARDHGYARPRRVDGRCPRRGRRLASTADAVRHHQPGEGDGARNQLRARRLPRCRADGRRVERQPQDAVQRSGNRRHLPAQRQADGTGRYLRQSATGANDGGDREGGARRVLQGLDRARDRQRHQAAQRAARHARLRRSQGRLGGADRRHLPRLRRARDAAEHAGATKYSRCRRARRGSSPSRC